MKNIYKKMYHKSKILDLKDNPRIVIMNDLIKKNNLNNCNVLDVGCYDGTFLLGLEGKNIKLYGLDASDYAVETCKKKGIYAKQYFFDDKEPFPFKTDTFDYVVAGEIIEHIYDTDYFLKEIRRVLKPKGKLLLSTPNIASLGRRIYLLLGKNPIIELSPNEDDSSGHIRYFTIESLSRLLNKNKFRVIESRSDIVNLSSSGSVKSKYLANLFPAIGQSIIVMCSKK